MAEGEKIRQHAKRALQGLTNRKKKWTERLIEFLWEVFIIIVAVNITLWFHNWSGKKHDRELVKEFLIDIRESLIQDTSKIQSYNNFMSNEVLVYYETVLSQIKEKKIDAQYIDFNYFKLCQNYEMGFNYSIFQSFSSAGNLRLIENRKLLDDIVFLYSSEYPSVDFNVAELYRKRNDSFEKYIGYKIGGDNIGEIKLSTIIHQPEVKYLIQMGYIFIKEINKRNEILNNQIVTIIHEIDRELKIRFKYKEK